MQKPPPEAPTRVEDKDSVSDYRLEHPAFGQLRASRVQGQTTLYGSDFVHQNFITVELTTSVMYRGLSHDWYHDRQHLFSVRMSEAQWATFVSAMNIGSGVPVTIEYRQEGEFKALPDILPEPKINAFKEDVSNTVLEMQRMVEEAEQVFEENASKVSGAVRQRMKSMFFKLKQELESNLPFIAKSLGEHMEGTVEKAKADVHAYVQGEVTRLGMAALLRGEDDTGYVDAEKLVELWTGPPKKMITIKKKPKD